jgi:hypothetical protein
MRDASNSRGPLCAETMRTLKAFFDRQQHYPSTKHWEALEDAAATMEAMADGTCQPRIFLSPIDPGSGKSKTVEMFAQALMTSEQHRSVGMLINVGRIAEAKAIAKDLAEWRPHIAVLTSDDEANSLGGSILEHAQLLITTQQRIELVTGDRTFEEIASFHYCGMPRAVRVWDEAWLPGKVITLGADDVAVLLKPARGLSPEFRQALSNFMKKLEETNTGEAIDVPDWEHAYGISHADLHAALPGGAEGRRHDHSERSAAKDYSSLNTHWWQRGGGKSSFEHNGADLCRGVAATIKTKPAEKWLVVTHKKDYKVGNIEWEISCTSMDSI